MTDKQIALVHSLVLIVPTPLNGDPGEDSGGFAPDPARRGLCVGAQLRQWGGFNTERGIAWAIEIGGPFKKVAWFARYRDVCYGPTDSETAKRAAIAFTKGATSFPDQGLATTFTGPIDLNADPILVADADTAASNSRPTPNRGNVS